MANNRYIRQTLLDRIGERGQNRLLGAHVVIVGCGGLGSIAGPYLAGAGVGRLTLIDGDRPDITNLHRQVFFSESSTTESKAELLRQHINSLNSEIEVMVITQMISKLNIVECLNGADLVLECTDNIQAKYLVNDYCHLNRIPMVYGAIYKYDGYVSFFENESDDSIHLRDIFPVPNDDIPTCSEVGVIGTIAGMIGLMQANEAIKFFTGAGDNLIGKLLSYDILSSNQMMLKLKKSWSGDVKELYAKSEYTMVIDCDIPEISINELQANRTDYVLISILEDNEHENIDDEVIRQPLSSLNIDKWKPNSDKPHVFYCMSGKRSSNLVNKLMNKGKVFSLIGGLRANAN